MAKKVNRNNSIAYQMNFRPTEESKRSDKKGCKPLPEPPSIPQVLLLMVVHLCRRVLFVDPSIKVGIYIMVVFFGSILSDVLPIPRTYFSRKDNIFNQYFVKLSWGWTMSVVGAFVYLTTSVYCCGEVTRLRRHFLRLILATCMWLFWTKSFVYVEETYGYCGKASIRSSKLCLTKGSTWHSFSISGHTFILIYCTLIIMEEAKALIGWEAIKDHLRNEEHNRTKGNQDSSSATPLELMTQSQLDMIREKYEKYTPYVRMVFILMTVLAIIWDVMLVATIIYFHSTPEKFVASVISVLIWFFTYQFLCHNHMFSMCLPGEGVFRYMNPTQPLQTYLARRASFVASRSSFDPKFPTFMGMPIGLVSKNQAAKEDATATPKNVPQVPTPQLSKSVERLDR
nr:EOG090X07YX [Sida crystallina]